MSAEYGIDLRSKSDAQIAEAVINSELEKVLGHYPQRAELTYQFEIGYSVPEFIKFNV